MIEIIADFLIVLSLSRFSWFSVSSQNKEQEAKEELKRRAKQLEMQRREAQKRGQSYMAGNYSGNFGNNSRSSSTYEASVQPVVEERSSYNRLLRTMVVSCGPNPIIVLWYH